MTEQLYCADCGAPMPADAQFCPACGKRQEPLEPAGGSPPLTAATEPTPTEPAPPPGPPPPASSPPPASPPPSQPAGEHGADPGAAARRAAQGAARRVEQIQPGAGELAAQLGRRLSTPGVIVAAICAAAALVACLVVGLVVAIATPDDSAIGSASAGEGLLTETLRLAVGTTMAHVDLEGGTDGFGAVVADSFPAAILPALFLLVPLGAVAAAAYLQAARTAGMGRWSRLLWPAASGIPLALVMLILALVAGGEVNGTQADFTIGSVLLYSLLWGALGGVGGSLLALRRSTPEALHGLAPASVGRWLPAVTLPLRSLAVLVVVMAVVGLVAVEIQVIKGEEAARGERSLPIALVESVTFAGEWGVGYTGLGLFSEYNLVGGASLLPPSDDDARAYAEQVAGGPDPGFSALTDARGRIFDYSAALPPYVFVPGLVLLIALPIVLALYAGFVTARAMGAPTQLVAAGWGAVVGIVWALALSIVRALGDIAIIEGGSLFAGALLVGTVAGAVGGLLAGEGAAAQPAPATAPERPGPPPAPPPYAA